MGYRPGGWLTERTERIPDTENEIGGIRAGSTEAMHSFRKAPEARQTLAQRVSAGYTSTNSPSAVGATDSFQLCILGIPQKAEIMAACPT
jgi:hypothetical protein